MPTLKEYIDEMHKQGKTPHFTNMPSEATPDSFAYNEDEFTADTEKQLETPGTGFDYTSKPPPPAPGNPPPGSVAPGQVPPGKIPEKPTDTGSPPGPQRDFKDRQKYSNFVVAKMGFDPFKLNPEEEIQKAQEILPDLFEATFGGKIVYGDVDKLDKDEKKHWNIVHRDFNAHVNKMVKQKIESGKAEYQARMKVFEDKQAEKKAMPAAVEKSLSSIFISTDENGKKVGKIPAGILAKSTKDAEQLMNTGNMSGAEAVAKITDDMVRERMRIVAIDEALADIPDMKTGWFSDDAKDVESVKSIITDAMEQGAEHKDIVSKLKDQGWDSKNIAKVLPAKGETGKPKQEYKTPEDIRNAFKGGEFGDPKSAEARQKAKQYLSRVVS